MRKLIIVAASIAALAAPTAAMAAAPDGSINSKAGPQSENASPVGVGSAALTQNGQFISGHNQFADTQWWADQTAAPGMRGDLVQTLLGHDH